MTDTILVFGASGRVGSAIIADLPKDVPVRAADVVIREDFPGNVTPYIFDFGSPPADLAPLFADVSRMFLLWLPGVDVRNQLAPIIRAAAEFGVQQVVFLSILQADKLRIVPHRTVEKMLQASGMDWVFLRSAYFMQNLSGMHLPEIRDVNQISLPAGRGNIGLVDVSDVAEVGPRL